MKNLPVIAILAIAMAAGWLSEPAAASARAAGGGQEIGGNERKKTATQDAETPVAADLAKAEILGVTELTWGEAAELCSVSETTLAAETRGRLLTVRSGDEIKRIFTTSGGTHLCENEPMVEPETGYLDDDLAQAVEVARRDLSTRLGVPLDRVIAYSAEKVTWRDSGIGCPQPDRVYMQMLTPGARIQLEFGGKEYAYHMAEGGEPVFCENPSARAPLPAVENE